jgi:pimeloyl-ACP methyl ester carboxylesterase
MSETATKTMQADGLRLAYREVGDGPPVLLLHGWPTSSFLWREVMGPIGHANRVIALDLPGFGASDKPVGIRYSFDFFARVLDLFLAQLGIQQLGLAVHDLGGPVGLHWALDRHGRLTKLALLNTLVYPEFSEAVKEFVRACATPELRDKLTSPSGLESIMRDGLVDPTKLSAEVLAAVQEPFRSAKARPGAGRRRDRSVAQWVRADRTPAPDATHSGACRVRQPRSTASRCRGHDGPGEGRPAPGRHHRSAGLRSLPPGRSPRGRRRVAGALLRAVRNRQAS